MANSVTLAQLRARALDYADMTGSAFPIQARVTDYVNAALSEIHYAMCNADADYDFATSSITLVAGTESYSLPSAFYKALKVYWVDGSGGTRRLYRIPQYDRNEGEGWRRSPIAAGTVELHYFPLYSPLVDTTDDAVAIDTKIPALPPGWEDYVALSAAIRLRAREQDMAQELRVERDRIMQQIQLYMAPRDSGEAEHISDVYCRWDTLSGGPYNTDLRALRYRIQKSSIYFIEVEFGAL